MPELPPEMSSSSGIAKIAVIGGGISGLSAAYLLSRRFRVTLFEKRDRLGGHTFTVPVELPDAPGGGVAVDMGFTVHNRKTYPNFCRLMAELKVESCASEMSFALNGGPRGLTWCSRGLNGLLAQRSNAFKPRCYALWREIKRFNKFVAQLLEDGASQDITLGEFLDEHRFTGAFRENYLYPLASAAWASALDQMDAFPAFSLLNFLRDQGFLDRSPTQRWRTIQGGTSRYIEPLTKPYADGIVLGARIKEIRRNLEGADLHMEDGEILRFDHVVFACHGDQVLPLLGDATKAERDVLSAFRTNRNPAAMHTDPSILDKRRRAWAAWNLRTTSDRSRVVLSQHMNRLQSLDTKTDVFVSLNADELLDSKRVLHREVFHHPRYDLATLQSQARWEEISGRYSAFGRTHYCGAHWGLGLHEDGLNSAIKVAESLGISW
ncbi:MAG: FAD-dependent oxidoreductase [Acidobacteriota bacterium]|nr:FAD-dependent oxidoreductase [Acidobacteriota bacterium]